MSTSNKIVSASINLLEFITLSSCGRKPLTERVFTFERVPEGKQRPSRLLSYLPNEGESGRSVGAAPLRLPIEGYESGSDFRRPGWDCRQAHAGSSSR